MDEATEQPTTAEKVTEQPAIVAEPNVTVLNDGFETVRGSLAAVAQVAQVETIEAEKVEKVEKAISEEPLQDHPTPPKVSKYWQILREHVVRTIARVLFHPFPRKKAFMLPF